MISIQYDPKNQVLLNDISTLKFVYIIATYYVALFEEDTSRKTN